MKYLIGLLIAIAVIIFIIIKLISGGGGGSSESQPATLSSYADSDTKVRMIIQNQTQASANHREIEVTVGKEQANLTVYKGYEHDAIRSKTYPMNHNAYYAFLRGLQISGKYTEGDDNPDHRDETGYCPLGTTYIYEVVDPAGNVSQHYWSTTCNVKTFKGDDDTVQQMFENQIPAFDDLTSDIDL